MKHKVVTRDARTATKWGGHVDKSVNRSYRRRINQEVSQLTGDEDEDLNCEPRQSERWTGWDTI
jgi:hypothetical protein